MDALRRYLKELKVILVKIPYLKSLLSQSKFLFGAGAFVWLLGSLLPDSAHFGVTFFSSIGRIAMFVGLFLTFVYGDEDRFIMIMSTIISIGCLIIIIIELAAVSYLASFETFLYAAVFGGLAINTSKYLNNQWYEEQKKKDDPTNFFSDNLSPNSSDFDSSIHVENVSNIDPYEQQLPEQPIQFDEPEIPLQEAAPEQPMDYYAQPKTYMQQTATAQEASATPVESHAQPEITEEKPSTQDTPTASTKAKTQRKITITPTKTSSPRLSDIKRAPSIRSAPSIGRAPGVTIKPKE